MTEIEIINIANEIYGKHTAWHGVQRQRLMMLAESLIAAEREACAKVIETYCHDDMTRAEEAAAIRARGQE